MVLQQERRQKLISYLQRDFLVQREEEKEVFALIGLEGLLEKEAKRVEGLKLNPGDVLLAKALGVLILLSLSGLFGFLLFGMVLSGIYIYLINFIIAKMKQARRKAIETQGFIDFLLDMASALNIVPSLLDALNATLPRADEKIRPEIEKIITEYEAGLTLDEALMNFAQRSQSATVMAWADGLILARKHGGDLAEICRKTAEKLRTKKRVEKEIKAAASGAKGTAMAIAVILFLALIMQVASGQLSMVLEQFWGKIAVSVITGLFLGGTFIIYNIIEKEAEL